MTDEKERSIVPSRIRKKKPAATTSESSSSTTTSPSTTSVHPIPPATVAVPSAASSTSSAPSPAVPNLPPASANIPAPPTDFVAGDVADYRAVLPRDSELRALPIAVKDVAKFTDYTAIFGSVAPSYAELSEALIVANAWSAMRTMTAAWDAFCGAQEGLSWTALRALMARMQTPFEAAIAAGVKLDTTYPGLATLLSAKKMIARKGASTRKLNAKAKAEGKQPTHGRIGKALQRRAEKAAYAAKADGNQPPATTPPASGETPVATASAAPAATKAS